MVTECENPKHKGENGKGCWWLKDPEWQYWCPNCVRKWWEKKLLGSSKHKEVKQCQD